MNTKIIIIMIIKVYLKIWSNILKEILNLRDHDIYIIVKNIILIKSLIYFYNYIKNKKYLKI